MILTPIVEQHADNAAFLWRLRDQAVRSPHYRLRDLQRLDDRVEAHLDGLRIAGDAGWTICEAALENGEAGELFTAALIAVERDDLRLFARVLDATRGETALGRGVVSALGWAPIERTRRLLPGLLHPKCPAALRWMGIAACAAHRMDPGAALGRALESDDRRLRGRALDAAGELGRKDLTHIVEQDLSADHDDLRFAAAWAAALLRSPLAIGALLELSESGGPRAERAMAMAVRCAGAREAGAWIESMAARPEATRAAVIAAGALGDPAHVPWLLHGMLEPAMARAAAEAYTMISGANLEDEDLDGPAPEGFKAGPNADPDDEDVAMDPDEELRWPNVDAIKAHWQKVRAGFEPGRRYFLGKPITKAALDEALQCAGQRQRAAAAIELALLHPGGSLYEVRAPAFRQ